MIQFTNIYVTYCNVSINKKINNNHLFINVLISSPNPLRWNIHKEEQGRRYCHYQVTTYCQITFTINCVSFMNFEF